MPEKNQAKQTQSLEKSTMRLNRRQFLKIGSAGAALGAINAIEVPKKALASSVSKNMDKALIKELDNFPNEIRKDYQPPRNYDTVFGSAFFGPALQAAGKPVDKEMMKHGRSFLHKINYEFDNKTKTHDQLSKALTGGAWSLSNRCVGPSPGAISDFGLMNWAQPKDKPPFALMDHNFVQKEKYQFKSKQEAAMAIKRAARLYGADLVGITRRDKKWDYREFLNMVPPMGREMFPPPPNPQNIPKVIEMMKSWGPDKFFHGWERFPFEPKTVIVLAFEMDYEGIAASPSEIGAAAVGAGYSQMAKVSYQMSVFLKQLGYHSVACGNDTGLSIPYAIAAGLGEGSRAGFLVTFNYGPRVRIAKVYTDFEFVDYDKPKTFGVMDFCKNCKRCADACPSKAISFDDEPSFEPTHDAKDNAYFNTRGVKKYYSDHRKCFQFWDKNGVDCANCIAACPYNKPDFWHHRLVRKMGLVPSAAVHDVLREADILFGYGNTFDEKAIDKFWSPQGRQYSGHDA
jgi:reductive dehalogenase